ncbi:MAG: 1-acyl-sn-glycerol-3-phosphate acyltransferase [Myxococcales bacterium]|nr:1-acyl-sn-glycerol-3-phosphate acyltransferase [Myxococcales bacterium]
MLAPLIRTLFIRLLKLYYPTLEVEGREHVPEGVPVIAVMNHPNALLDPLVLRVGLDRPVSFLGKSTLFGNPLGRAAMEAFDGIPVYRHRDKGQGGGDPAKNEETFALCRERLDRGGWVALFPEGTSHSDPQMKPLKTGAARIALSAVVEKPGAAALRILPAGLYFEEKATFRSRCLLTLGPAIRVADYLDDYRRDPRATVDRLTDDIRAALDRVVLQADNHTLLDGLARVAEFTAAGAPAGLGAQHRRALTLRARYDHWAQHDPARLDAVTASAQRYFRILQGLGVRDPWSLEVLEVTPRVVLVEAVKLAALLPFAAVGVLLGWVPYRLAGKVAARFVGESDDVLGTAKMIGGALFVVVYWLLESLAAAHFYGPLGALAVLVMGPLGGYAALRFEERLGVALRALSYLQLRKTHVDVVRAVGERRRQLAQEIEAMLAEAPAP